MSDEADDNVDAHLSDLDDGCGCVEVWTHTSEQRANGDGTDDATSE